MFEVSKTAINMAEKRGFTVEKTEFAGNTHYVFNRNGKLSFSYVAQDDKLKFMSIDPDEAELTQGAPDEITEDAQLRVFLKNWPLTDGESESEDKQNNS